MMGVLDLRWVDGELQMLIRYQLIAVETVSDKQTRTTTHEERWEPVPTIQAKGDASTANRFLPRRTANCVPLGANARHPAPGGV